MLVFAMHFWYYLTRASGLSRKPIVCVPIVFGRRAFSVAGSMVWNSLPDFLRDTSLSEDTFRRSLKTYFFCVVLKHVSALEALRNALYKFSTYLLREIKGTESL